METITKDLIATKARLKDGQTVTFVNVKPETLLVLMEETQSDLETPPPTYSAINKTGQTLDLSLSSIAIICIGTATTPRKYSKALLQTATERHIGNARPEKRIGFNPSQTSQQKQPTHSS